MTAKVVLFRFYTHCLATCDQMNDCLLKECPDYYGFDCEYCGEYVFIQAQQRVCCRGLLPIRVCFKDECYQRLLEEDSATCILDSPDTEIMQQVVPSGRMSSAMQALRNAMQQQNLSKQEALDLLKILRDNEYDMDYDYILCVLFPEHYPAARVPCRFSVPSALFTHRFSYYLGTGVLGAGFVSFLPLDTSYMACYSTRSTTSWDGNETNDIYTGDLTANVGSSATFISTNYAQVRLVGASMRIQYIGQADQESGIMTGSHVYESEIGRISNDIVENGYFCTRAKPSQGIRLVWVPKDNADMEFYDCNFIIQEESQNLSNTASRNYVFAPSVDIYSPGSATTTSGTSAVNFSVKTYSGANWVDSSGTERTIYVAQVWGHGAKRLQATHPTQLVVQWTGLPASQNWIRVDVDRHFEGVPRIAIRDLVSVAKPKANEKTLDAMKSLSNVDLLFGQKQSDADVIKNSFTSNMADTMTDLATQKILPAAVDMGLKYATDKIFGAGSSNETFMQGITYANTGSSSLNMTNPYYQAPNNTKPSQLQPQKLDQNASYADLSKKGDDTFVNYQYGGLMGQLQKNSTYDSIFGPTGSATKAAEILVPAAATAAVNYSLSSGLGLPIYTKGLF